MTDFYRDISLCLAKSIGNYYPDNFDRAIKDFGFYRRVVVMFEQVVRGLGRLLSRDLAALVTSSGNFYLNNLSDFEPAYNCLSDEESRKKYIELLAYRMLGFTKVRLSIDTPEFWSARERVAVCRRPEQLSVNFKGGLLDLYDLDRLGYEGVKLFFVANGVVVDFILQQYNYKNLVCVSPGDVVVDAGACWGDTALYFAARGAQLVLAYEFIPSNICIFKRNVALNPKYSARIELVENAVWEKSRIGLSFDDRGPASCVDRAGVYPHMTQTLSVDDLVKERGLDRVDFIKMDIEGAELPALRGCAETIRKYRPKLAVSVYHRADDFVSIPEYLRSLNPGYEFYLDYFTTVGDEIMLYAIDQNGK